MPLNRLRVELDKMGKGKIVGSSLSVNDRGRKAKLKKGGIKVRSQLLLTSNVRKPDVKAGIRPLKRLENFWQRKENRGQATHKKISV